MELKQLRYFLAICEEMSISNAAKKLFISQPPLSQQLKMLEEELGCELFKRTTRSLEITEAGRILRERARRLLELSEDIIHEVRSSETTVSGTLKIGFVASSSAALLPHRIPDFFSNYPHINFQIKEGNTHRILELLDNGIIEIGVVRSPFDTSKYHCIELTKEPMAAVAALGFLPDSPTAIALEALKPLPLIIDKRFEKLFTTSCEKRNFTPNIMCEGEDSRSLLLWAAAGLGVAILPMSAASLISYDNLTIREIDCSLLYTNTVIAWLRNRPLTPVAKSFLSTFSD